MLYIVLVFSASYPYVLCVIKHISDNVKSQKKGTKSQDLTSLCFQTWWGDAA